MAQAQTKGDKHILVMNDAELEVVRNGAILNTKVAVSGDNGINVGSLKASIEVLDAVTPIFDTVNAPKAKSTAKA